MSAPQKTETIAPALFWTPAVGQLIDLALQEDLGHGDITTESVGVSTPAVGTIICREAIVCCGLPVADWLVDRAEPELSIELHAEEGAELPAGSVLARLHGKSDAILRVERVTLNFLMRLCGVATLTKRYVDAVAGSQVQVVDTRKTLPGWRALDKYAVRAGGGRNHRFDLASGVLIKDNHIVACGSVAEAVKRAKARAPHPLRIEVEVETLEMVEAALRAGADVLLLDNMTPGEVADAVALVDGQAVLEVSGGVTLETIREMANARPNLISVGALTHSAPAVDLSLDLSR